MGITLDGGFGGPRLDGSPLHLLRNFFLHEMARSRHLFRWIDWRGLLNGAARRHGNATGGAVYTGTAGLGGKDGSSRKRRRWCPWRQYPVIREVVQPWLVVAHFLVPLG